MKWYVFICCLVLFAGTTNAQPTLHVLWDRSGAGANASYGYRVFALGDQNNDSYNDFAVWGLGQAAPGDSNQAVVELFHGGNPPASQPYMRFTADPATELRFYDVNAAGDVNGDGYIDWWIMRLTSDETTFTFQVYYGGPNADTIPDVVLHPGLSFWIAAGDFNGDGFDDLYAKYETNPDSGRMFYGGSPMDTVPDWVKVSPPGHNWQAYAQSFGDVNGDGYSDFVSGTSPSISMTYIFLGGVHPDTVPAYTWTNFYSATSEIVKDMNGDHKDDLVFASSGGHLDVHLGRDALSSIPDYTLNFDPACYPFFICSMGDINRDGHSDLAVVDDFCNNGWGTFMGYLGHPWLNPDPAFIIQGRDGPLNLIGIRTAAGLGDINGDHIDDWAIGAFNTNWDGRRGRVVVISGDTTLRADVKEPHTPSPQDIQVHVFPNPFNSETTIALEVPLGVNKIEVLTYNLLGQTVRRQEMAARTATMRFVYDAAGLVTGIYLLHIQAGKQSAVQKIVVIR
jgi:hypothetical protein